MAAACRAGAEPFPTTVPGWDGPVCELPGAGRWLAEHEAKALLRTAGVAVVDGRLVHGEDDAVAALADSAAPSRSSSRARAAAQDAAGALALDVAAEPASAPPTASSPPATAAPVLVERMAPPGAELIVAVRRDAVVPALVIGLGGVYAEAFDDVAVVPLPATPARVEAALRSLRGAALLAGADLPAAARLAAALTEIPGLELIECNPVLVHEEGAVVVDALAKEIADMNAIAKQLGEVGLPAPVKELAARDWDAIVVGGGHNGLTCAAYLARPASPCSCSSAASGSAARARSSARSPTPTTSSAPAPTSSACSTTS